MDNSNIIISVIIVLCIAAGVTAYGLSEGDNAVFNDLTGFSPDSSDSGSNGIGDLIGNDSNQGTGSGVSTGVSSGSNGGGSSNSGSSSSSGSSSNGGSNSGSGSGNNGGSGSSGGTGTSTGSSGSTGNSSSGSGSGSTGQSSTQSKISASQAKSIAAGFIGEQGAYVSSVSDDGSEYICYISDANGTQVDAIAISYSGENLGRA